MDKTMKIREFFRMLFIAFLAVAGLTACSNEDGDWESMKWKTDVKMEKGHSISVPVKGGSYLFTCRNYGCIWFSDLQENGDYIVLDDFYQIRGKWVTADVDNNVLTVTISPNDSGKQRTVLIGVSAGDIFDSFTFNQDFQ